MMNADDCSYMVDTAVMFFDYIRIEGWFHSPTDILVEVELRDAAIAGVYGTIGLPHAGVQDSLGPDLGFRLQTILDASRRTENLQLVFRTRNGKTIEVMVLDLCIERKKEFPGPYLLDEFIERVGKMEHARLLDIGGRARSGIDRRGMFPRAQSIVLDILPGEGVDVVGDAHAMSKLFPPNSFDAIFSVSVFEHILMPWVVAREMASLLRLGGLGYVSTHQTIGMHDQPWDFWRFSDTAWYGLFNKNTGFEILGRAIDHPQYIVPHFWTPEQRDSVERATGYLSSNVMVRKISEPAPGWEPVELAGLLDTAYPDKDEPPPVWIEKHRQKFPRD